MRLLLIAVVLTSGFTALSPAQANTFDGNAYLDFCNTVDASSCDGFRFGLITGLVFWNSVSADQGGPALKYCLPGGVGTTQAMDIVSAYIQNHPETRHYPAGMLAVLALQEAFPCR